MEEYNNASLVGRGGKHEPARYPKFSFQDPIIKAQGEDKVMRENPTTKDYEVFDSAIRMVNSEHRKPALAADKKTNYAGRYEAIRKNSIEARPIKAERHRAKVDPFWRKATIAVTLSAIIFAGGVKSSESILGKLAKWENEWELRKDTKSYAQMVESNYTKKTYTQDSQIEYDKIAASLEKDGIIDNRELYTMVAALGEVQADEVLRHAQNPPASNVEDYMRRNNIADINDWRKKTADAMAKEERIESVQADLDAIFKESTENGRTTENALETEGNYGGK